MGEREPHRSYQQYYEDLTQPEQEQFPSTRAVADLITKEFDLKVVETHTPGAVLEINQNLKAETAVSLGMEAHTSYGNQGYFLLKAAGVLMLGELQDNDNELFTYRVDDPLIPLSRGYEPGEILVVNELLANNPFPLWSPAIHDQINAIGIPGWRKAAEDKASKLRALLHNGNHDETVNYWQDCLNDDLRRIREYEP